MKKILFATTALVATAGVASAQDLGVSLTGYAEMGVTGGDTSTIQGSTTYDDVAQFHSDIDVTFTLSGEADNGLTFGATIDLDEEGGFGSSNGGPEAVFVSFGGATLTMGDTDSAFDARLTEVGIGGSINDDHTTHFGYNGNSLLDGFYDGQIARFDYTFDAFTMSLSAQMDDLNVGDPLWSIGVSYNAQLAGLDLGVGLAYQTVDPNGSGTYAPAGIGALPIAAGSWDQWGISLDTTFDNGLQAIVNYSDLSFPTSGGGFDGVEHWGLGLGYTMNALTLSANYGVFDYTGVSESAEGWGLAANYDLGGGLEVQFGYGASSTSYLVTGVDSDGLLYADDEFHTYSLGLAMSF